MNAVIVGCSRRKLDGARQLQAIELYQGWCFPWLRCQLDSGRIALEQVFIASALHGLLNATDKIDTYDCALSDERVVNLRPRVTADVQERVIRCLAPLEVVAIMERPYYSLFEDVFAGSTNPRLHLFHNLASLWRVEMILSSWLHHRREF